MGAPQAVKPAQGKAIQPESDSDEDEEMSDEEDDEDEEEEEESEDEKEPVTYSNFKICWSNDDLIFID